MLPMGNILLPDKYMEVERCIMKLSSNRLEAISRNIKGTRIERSLTQEIVAELAGVSPVYYCQIELGNKSPSLETLINIAEAMHVSVDTLIYGVRKDSRVQDLLQLFEKCDEKQMAKLHKLLYTVAEEFLFDDV